MASKNSFDLIRICAAFLVLISHSFALTGQPEPQLFPGYTLGRIGVAVFFSLSGYLVFQSLDRDSRPLHFLAKRGIRIFPGLSLMLLITVLLIGPLTSTLTAHEYFSRAEAWRYLGKIKLWGDDRLPGVFEQNQYPNAVNSSLWTLKWEWLMYCLLGCLAFIRRTWWRGILFTLFLVFSAMALLSDALAISASHSFLAASLPNPSSFLLGSFFFIGALLAVSKLTLDAWLSPAIHWVIFGAACAVLAVGGSLATLIALWMLVPAVIFWVGESSIGMRIGLDIRHDLSYGMYIYAFPIQQSIAAFLPKAAWWESLLLATPLTAGLAFLSWIYIEQPALRLKTQIIHLEWRGRRLQQCLPINSNID